MAQSFRSLREGCELEKRDERGEYDRWKLHIRELKL